MAICLVATIVTILAIYVIIGYRLAKRELAVEATEDAMTDLKATTTEILEEFKNGKLTKYP